MKRNSTVSTIHGTATKKTQPRLIGTRVSLLSIVEY